MVWGAVLFLAACTSTSEGLCEDAADCLAGLSCQEGVCVGCAGDGECQAWQACTTDRRCELREGMCEKSSQCKSWETCGADNTCVLAADACTSAADCKAYESCDAAKNKCVLQADRCRTAADCGGSALWAPTCDADNRCQAGEGPENDVILWGTLRDGANCGYDAFSSILTPTRVQVGFGCETLRVSYPVLAPDGRIHYIDRGETPHRLKVFVPDAFKSEAGKRVYPSDGPANDTLIPTTKCAAGQNVGSFHLQAGTGALAYSCIEEGNTSSSTTLYDAQGDVVAKVSSVNAWNADDYILEDASFRAWILGPRPQRGLISIQGLPADWSISHARADKDGFLVLLAVGFNVWAPELWRISNSGQATRVGPYAALPDNVFSNSPRVLDRAGNVYVIGKLTGTGADVIVKRSPDGSPGEIVYSEASAPSSVNEASNYSQLFNFIYESGLITGL
ncbi:hypothetical protein [Corallococcus exercitus]|uniref:hypothetical protein n=1 Tax=Corallococcus exercitus TaxID=2316736 RepID=UPI0035D48EC5